MKTPTYSPVNLTPQEFNPKDWRFGGITGWDPSILREDGDYTENLPDFELQHSLHFDSFGCVSFSANNCIEVIGRVFGYIWNWSDRFLAKQSGTTRTGNSLSVVAETLRTFGCVDEDRWPYPREMWGFDWDDFYSQIPQEIIDEAKEFLKSWDVNWRWVNPHDVKEAMKYGPVQVGVYAWPKKRPDGKYDDAGKTKRNHAVACVKFDTHPVILDHYDPFLKELVADYDFKFALQFYIIPKREDSSMPLNLPNNCLVQQTGPGANGAFGLHLDGKIYVDETDKILASWSVRSSDFNNKRAISKEEWDKFPHFDLKNNPL